MTGLFRHWYGGRIGAYGHSSSLFDPVLTACIQFIRRSHTLSLQKEVPESVRTPAVADWLEGVALRDLVLQENHAACIDARGDVYQWGDGYFGTANTTADASSSGKPVLTLRNKVRPEVYSMSGLDSLCTYISEYCQSTGHRRPSLCSVRIW